ncbi:TetR family transcriptional regulator [Amycolatopsis sp. NBC_00345]|uniref:TetR/AcrR family transcriptional regulator n=1 Tax=Amycolatopsis sp. NBC_00345 TaxID=2975955 RepID=UPI002E26D43B
MRINEGPADAATVTNTARRAQIVAAAIETIAEVGYAKASFARITAAAALSSPRMISYHFAGKDDLMRQIVEDVLGTAVVFMRERIEAEESAGGRLRAYLESNLEFLRDHPREMAALTEIGPHFDTGAGAPATSVSVQEPSVLGLEVLLRGGQAAGEFRDFDIRSMAVMIRGAVDAAAQRLRAEPGFDFDAYSREVVASFTLATDRPAPKGARRARNP